MLPGRAGRELRFTDVREMAPADGPVRRIPGPLQSFAHLSAGWGQSGAVHGGDVSSSANRRAGLQMHGNDLPLRRDPAFPVWVFLPAAGSSAAGHRGRYGLACKNTLQTMEKFGTIEEHYTVR